VDAGNRRGRGLHADSLQLQGQPFVAHSAAAVHDLSSRGRCHRAWCDKVGRQLELFSDTEYGAFLIAEGSPRVVDIQEQFPLDRELSQSCARALGMRHPTYPGTHVPTVLTVDLLVTAQTRTGVTKIGIDCKVKTDAEDRRTLKKLDLARVCLEQRG
jgi:hypothetical protein